MRLAEIRGQQAAVAQLQAYRRAGSLRGGFLFVGPEGIGKFAVAGAFARALVCAEAGEDACGRCPACLRAGRGQHPDVTLIDPGGAEIGVEEVRSLQDRASLRPYEAALKIFVINNAHQLNAVSANAFLKTLEEPPGYCLIILVTHKPGLLLKTIVSRCRTVKFLPFARGELAELLCREHGMAPDSGRFLAHLCEGRLGAALRLKDTPVLDRKNRLIDMFAGAHAAPDEKMFKDRSQLRECLSLLATWFRDVYLYKAGAAQDELIHRDRRNDVALSAQGYSFARLDEIIDCISQGMAYLDQNVNMKLLMANLQLVIGSGQ